MDTDQLWTGPSGYQTPDIQKLYGVQRQELYGKKQG